MPDIFRQAVAWVRLLSSPGTGRCRAGARLASLPTAEWQSPTRSCAMRLPAHRSPYGLADPLDGGANAMVRPYLDAHERGFVRRQRPRRAPVLAADFRIDLDWHSVGAPEVAA